MSYTIPSCSTLPADFQTLADFALPIDDKTKSHGEASREALRRRWQYPILTRRLLDLVSERFISVLMDLDATSFRQLIPRLAALLLERTDGDLVRNLTHKELAQHLHVYRESVSRTRQRILWNELWNEIPHGLFASRITASNRDQPRGQATCL